MKRLLSPIKRYIKRVVCGPQVDVPTDLDGRTQDTIRFVRPYTMTGPERIAALCESIRYITRNRIEGAIVECGVWRGGSMMAAARTLLEEGDGGRDLYLFDTFEGMTVPGSRDVAYDGTPAIEQYRQHNGTWCLADMEDVTRSMSLVGYDFAKVHMVKGKVEETIPAQAPERIALLRLDTDWYESTRHELVHLYPRLVPGGVLIIDDYGHWKGSREAVDEYLAENALPLLLMRIDYSGRLAVVPFRP